MSSFDRHAVDCGVFGPCSCCKKVLGEIAAYCKTTVPKLVLVPGVIRHLSRETSQGEIGNNKYKVGLFCYHEYVGFTHNSLGVGRLNYLRPSRTGTGYNLMLILKSNLTRSRVYIFLWPGQFCMLKNRKRVQEQYLDLDVNHL